MSHFGFSRYPVYYFIRFDMSIGLIRRQYKILLLAPVFCWSKVKENSYPGIVGIQNRNTIIRSEQPTINQLDTT